MTPYFSNPDRVADLASTASAWEGTPFHPNGCVVGVGVSCQKLVGALMSGCGIEMGSVPDGPMDWQGGPSLIEDHMDVALAARFITIFGASVGGGSPIGCADVPIFLPGDIVGFRVGSSVKHVGIMVDAERFIHVMRHSSVSIVQLCDPTWIGRLSRVWRAIEL